MKLDSAAVHYLLVQGFDDAISAKPSRSVLVDYPMLYDTSADMSGHTVLVPEHERPGGGPGMRDVLCVCMGNRSAQSAREAGLAVIEVRGDVTFQRLYNYMQTVFVRMERLDARLRAYIDTYAGFQPLLDACSEAMKCPCALIDDQFRSAYQSLGEANGIESNTDELLESEIIDLFMASRGYRHMRSSHNVFTIPGSSDLLMKNVFSGNKLVGTLIVRHEGTALSAQYMRFVIRLLNPFVEEMYARIGSFNAPEAGSARVHVALEQAAVGDASDAMALAAVLAEDGHGKSSRYVVVNIERSFTNDGVESRDYVARRFEIAWPGSYCFTVADDLFMFVDLETDAEPARSPFLRDIPSIARDNLSKVGISRPFDSVDGLKAACRQAVAALMVGNGLEPTRWCYRFADYALQWLLDRARGDEPVESYRHPAVGILRRYDDEHGTELVKTLTAFMSCRFNATAAADELFVARSTLLNRLERIRELTGVDLEDTDELLYLGLSLRM